MLTETVVVYRFGRVFDRNEKVLSAFSSAAGPVEMALAVYRRTRDRAGNTAILLMGLRRRAGCVVAMLPRDLATLLGRMLWAQRDAVELWRVEETPQLRRSKRLKKHRGVGCE